MGTNILPDLHERYLQGNIIGGKYLEPGLPNIIGTFPSLSINGASGSIFKQISRFSTTGSQTQEDIIAKFGFDASRSNSIYGKSNTVQPPSMTVRYYIRAK